MNSRKQFYIIEILISAAKAFNDPSMHIKTDLFGIAMQYDYTKKVKRKDLEDFVLKMKLKIFLESICPSKALPWHKNYSYYPQFKMQKNNQKTLIKK